MGEDKDFQTAGRRQTSWAPFLSWTFRTMTTRRPPTSKVSSFTRSKPQRHLYFPRLPAIIRFPRVLVLDQERSRSSCWSSGERRGSPRRRNQRTLSRSQRRRRTTSWCGGPSHCFGNSSAASAPPRGRWPAGAPTGCCWTSSWRGWPAQSKLTHTSTAAGGGAGRSRRRTWRRVYCGPPRLGSSAANRGRESTAGCGSGGRWNGRGRVSTRRKRRRRRRRRSPGWRRPACWNRSSTSWSSNCLKIGRSGVDALLWTFVPHSLSHV